MANTPNIRFKGFTEDWEQRKLSKMCDKFTDGDWIEAKDQSDSGVRLIQTGNVGVAEYLDKTNNTKWISQDTFDRLHCEEVFPGDILISRLPEPAGRACIIPFLGTKMITAVDCTIIRTSENYSSAFLVQYLSSQAYFNKVNTCLAGGTRQRISRGNLAVFDVPVPHTLQEQEQIGAFFKQLDDLIILHQRKCDETKELKKVMLQKMFPKNGEKSPEIRFEGFTDDWEQRRLGEISTRVQGNDGRMDLPTLTISAANGWMDQRDRFSGNIAGKEQKNYTLLHKGELSYNHGNSKLAKYGAVFSLQTYEEALVPKVYHSFKIDEGNADFIEYYFATKIPDRELGKLISSGARMDGLLNISFDEFMSIKMMIPSTVEQSKIANHFRRIDNLITLHQRKCDQLKDVKKYMLQNMFPQKG